MDQLSLSQTLSFFKSVIQSGEDWSATCQAAFDSAQALIIADTANRMNKGEISVNHARNEFGLDRLTDPMADAKRAPPKPEKLFFDLFNDGRWIGMAYGVDEDDARRMAARSLPNLLGRFSLTRWYGRLHPHNCRTSGGSKPDPRPEPYSRDLLRKLIEVAWLEAGQDSALTTDWENRLIQRAVQENVISTELHPATQDLLTGFMAAFSDKLRAAEIKYRYSDGWARPDWEAECRLHLMQHIKKGDPLDVASFCAFMWKHGWSTRGPDAVEAPKSPDERRELLRRADGIVAHGFNISYPSRVAAQQVRDVIRDLAEALRSALDFRWHLGTKNDGLFIINKPSHPSNDDAWHDRPDEPTMVLNVTELPAEKAQAIVDAHNAMSTTVSPAEIGSVGLAEAMKIVGLADAMKIVGDIRQSEAGLFDAKHSGQRGQDRSDALYDAYEAIRKALVPRTEADHG